MNFLNIAVFTINLIKIIHNAGAQENINIYRKLPPLYDFDNYDHCFFRSNSTYCMIFAEIESNNFSDIWLNIERISNDSSHHYRHDNLFFGVCVEQCKELLKNWTPQEVLKYSSNTTLENEITKYHRRIYKRKHDFEDRQFYHNILDICLNFRFRRDYNLSVATNIEYCEKSQDFDKLDLLDITFFIIILTIIFLNLMSSLYDYKLKLKNTINLDNNDFYKNQISDTGFNFLLTSFSICRNYYRLTRSPTNNTRESELNFTYFFRVFALFIVILGHCTMLLMSVQIQNPEFIENYYYKAGTMIVQNGSAIIQIFFVLAGFLLKLKFDEKNLITSGSSYKKGAIVYVQCFLLRYLRLFPSLMMVILFNATLLIRLGDGPFWRHIAESEYTFCREYWWKNVFMINNFMLEDSCAQQTWFLAADMQLYELFLFINILMAKYNILKQPLYIVLGIMAFLVPGLITYFYELEAIHFLKPETYRYLYFKDADTFYLTYPQFYCNIGGYLVGFLCAEIYLKNSRQIKQNFRKYRGIMKFEIPLLAFIFLIAMSLLISGNLVFEGYLEKPSVWLSLYASLYRNIWAILGGFVLMCMIVKMGWIAYDIANLSIFTILGRISFQSYLWHVTVLKLLEGFYRQPIYLNEFHMVCQIILAFILTNLLGFFMVLLVEYPFSEIVHYILKSKTTQNADVSKELKPHIHQIHL